MAIIGLATSAAALAPLAVPACEGALAAVSPAEILAYAARIVRVGAKLRGAAEAADDAAMAEMLELMRSRAPVRSGALRNAIEGHTEGEGDTRQNVITAKVHARRGGGEGADYAPFVEFGTDPHGAATADYFETSRARPVAGHPGTEAQPFFWNSAREVLRRRRADMGEIIDGVAAEEGFDNG